MRSRTGCLACKSRKRRCGEEKPACKNCLSRGLTCPYLSESAQPVTVRFKVYRGDGKWVSLRSRPRWHFLNLSSREIPLLSSEQPYNADPPKKNEAPVIHEPPVYHSCIPPPKPLLSDTLLRNCNELEKQLFQYYLQVISKVRVFQDEPRNHFRTLVVPLCAGKSPLLYAVLSVSAHDRRAEQPISPIDYGQLSLSYKSLALRALRQSLADVARANEALMTCLILCSLEISAGCRPDWVQHAQGAFALIRSFAATIDPDILFFAYSYFESRATFFRTTGCHEDGADGQTTSDDLILRRKLSQEILALTQQQDQHQHQLDPSTSIGIDSDAQCRIQPHLGCSLRLLDIIAHTTDLIHQKRRQRDHHHSSTDDALAIEESLLDQAMSIRSAMDALVETNPSGSEYLATCASCFRLAADLFLQLACDIPLSQPALQKLLARLLRQIGRVIREDQERQLFPMWPLFLAGCLSTTDADRLRVLDSFSYVARAWPVSNVPVVREATETIWKVRDWNCYDGGRSGFDWQMVIAQMNWKLALS